MKKFILSLAIAMYGYCSYAQWTTNQATNDAYNTNASGKVGIGTTTPTNKLDIVESSTNNSYITVSNNTIGTLLGAGGTFHGIVGTTTNHDFAIYTNLSEKMRITSTGKVGIGTTSPTEALNVAGNFKFGTDVSAVNAPAYGIFGANVYSNNGNGGSVTIQAGSGSGSGINGDLILRAGQTSSPVSITTGGNLILESGKPSNTLAGGYIAFNTYSGNPSSVLERMRISSSGNILIGQTSQANPDYKLDVYGKARANEIVVNTSGADFVFDKKYILPKLLDVKAYIDKNQHLPEIPSAKEMQANGMSVGEINTKLLQKVEELTLYAIEQQKRINQLEGQQTKSEQQEARIAVLEKALLKLTESQSK